jgi:hypothetical protein
MGQPCEFQVASTSSGTAALEAEQYALVGVNGSWISSLAGGLPSPWRSSHCHPPCIFSTDNTSVNIQGGA